MLFNTKILTIAFLLINIFYCTISLCDENINNKKVRSIINIVSASHLGLAKIQKSTTGYKGSDGSVMFLDILKKMNQNSENSWTNFAIGLRTYASGASNNNSKFYRLASGLLIENIMYQKWYIQFGISLFKEEASFSDNSKYYKSQGILYQINWGHIIKIVSLCQLSLGGFWDLYHGNLDLSYHNNINNNIGFIIDKTKNIGLTQGIDISLRITL